MCWDRLITLVNSLPMSELGNLSPEMFVAVMCHAKTEYGGRSPGVSIDPNSLCANLRAVDERLRMACEAQGMMPAAVNTIDEDILQLVNF